MDFIEKDISGTIQSNKKDNIQQKPKKILKIFSETKSMLNKLIGNQINSFIEEYITYIKDYTQFYNKNINQSNTKFQPNLDRQQIKNILIQGIRTAKTIIQPSVTIQGLTANQRIYINLNFFLAKLENNLCEEEQKNNLLKAVMSLTILHQLSHYLVRKLGFKFDKDQSFSYKAKQKASLYQKFILNKSKLICGSKEISLQTAKFVVQNQEKLKNFCEYISLNITEKHRKMQQIIFEYIVYEEISNHINFQTIIQIENKIIIKQSQANNPSNHPKNNRAPANFDKLLKLVLNSQKFHKQHTQAKQNNLLQKLECFQQNKSYKYVINNHFQEKLSEDTYKFIRETYSQLPIEKIQYDNVQKVEKKFQEIQIDKQYEEGLFNMLCQRLGIGKKQIQKKQMLNKVLQALSSKRDINLTGILKVLDLSKLCKKTKIIETLYQFTFNVKMLIKQCRDFIQFKNLMPIEMTKKLESGYILEERLFENLHDGYQSQVFSYDYETLCKLCIETNKNTCKQLRKQFASKKNDEFKAVSMFVNRSKLRKGISLVIPGNSCLHWVQQLVK